MSTLNVGVGNDLERMTAAVHNALHAENPVTRHVCQQIIARKLLTQSPPDPKVQNGHQAAK